MIRESVLNRFKMQNMKKLFLIGLLCAACSKEPVSVQKSMTTIRFQNQASFSINYATGCQTNSVQTGVDHFVCSASDTICSFKIADGIVSWKSRPGHVVSLGGCPFGSSLTIVQ